MSSVTTSFEKNKTLFFLCDCRNEVLFIEYDHEINMADFAIYSSYMSHRHSLSLWQRIRYAIRVLFYKRPYSDQIMLNRDQLHDLKLFLGSIENHAHR